MSRTRILCALACLAMSCNSSWEGKGPAEGPNAKIFEQAGSLATSSSALRSTWATRSSWSRDAAKEAWLSPGAITKKTKEIALQLPRKTNDAFTVSDALHADRSVTLTAKGASGATYEVSSGDAIAHNVFPAVDEIVTVRPSAWESFYLLQNESAAHEFHWQVTLGSGIHSTSRGGDGSLLFQGDNGEVALAMPAPLAVDASGSEIHPTLSYANGDLSITFDPTGVKYPVLLDPTITSWSWSKQAIGPFSNVSLTYDEDRSVAVTFGGGYALSSDTYEWDGSFWKKVALAVSPPARNLHSIAYDSVRKRIFIFGGSSSNGVLLGDFWEYNGSAWVERTSATSPSKRSGAYMSFDEKLGKVVLFGGSGSTETWEWDGSAWAKKILAHSPPARGGGGFAYDATRKVNVLHGGSGQSDTWEYDGVDWTDKSSGSLGTASSAFQLVYDRSAKKMLRVGNGSGYPADSTTVKVWNGSTWQVDSTPALPSYGGGGTAYDTKRGVVLTLVNGNLLASASGGGAWVTKAGQLVPTTASYTPMSAYAPGLGGLFFAPPQGSESWTWDGYVWTKKTVTNTNAAIGSAVRFVYDPSATRVLMIQADAFANETYVWSYSGGASWTKLPGLLAANKGQGSAVFDTQRNKIVLFGGSAGGAELWEWDSVSGWVKRTTATAAPARQNPAMAYDPVRQRTVIAGGTLVTSTDTWEYDGTDFKRVTPAHAPTVFAGTLIYDSQIGKCVLFASDTTVWEYDGTDWTKRLVANATSALPQAFATTGGEFNFDGRSPVIFVPSDLSFWRLNANYGGCTNDAECPNPLLCTDGVCCASKSCNACETCNGTSPGVCTAVINQTDPDSCSGTSSCDASGVCKTSIGSTCATNSQCTSGFCVDGVCCDSSCTGTCVACKDTMKEEQARSGLCGAALKGTDVRNQCASTTASTCGLDGMCDGKGACRLYSKGTTCSAAIACPTDGLATPQVCDGLGTCGPQAPSTDCLGYKCTTNVGCGTTCAADGDCSTGYRCDGAGKCVSKSNFAIGSACANGYDCGTGYCVDGVCCDTACNGTCVACKDTLKDSQSGNGTCGAALKGTDIRNQCATTAASTCGSDGMCDGKGSCRLYSKGTTCSAAIGCATDGTAVPQVCDGLGTCGPQAPATDCLGYKCLVNVGCGTSCVVDGDCATNFRCNAGGKCVARSNFEIGYACSNGVDCLSGFCVDGVCCDSACNGTCVSCKNTLKADSSTNGVCGPSLGGTDPRNQCDSSDKATCGTDGTCDGKGACRLYTKGTACGAGVVCPTESSATGVVCDGLGTCGNSAELVACEGFKCVVDKGCGSSCTTNKDCAANYRCDDKSKCVTKLDLAQGAACTQSFDCASGSCVDGVCCDTACNGLCVSCTAAQKADGSKDGTCGPTRLGSDPKNQCDDSPVSSCGQDGFCDGAGACHKFGPGTACGPDTTCLTATTATGQVCDGLGSCAKRTDGVECKGFVCAPGSGCLVTCTVDTECVTGFFCSNQQCVPRNGLLCADDHHVASPGGTPIDCGNYLCRAGVCLTGCTSIDDCGSDLVCDFEGHCSAPPTIDTGASEGCSFTGNGGTTSSSRGGLLAFAAVAFLRRRRQRESLATR